MLCGTTEHRIQLVNISGKISDCCEKKQELGLSKEISVKWKSPGIEERLCIGEAIVAVLTWP